MLRLTLLVQTQEEAVLQVEGWVSDAEVALLEEEGTRLLQESQRLVLDLHGLRFLDQAALQLLQRWSGERLVLRGASAFICTVLTEHGLQPVDPERKEKRRDDL